MTAVAVPESSEARTASRAATVSYAAGRSRASSASCNIIWIIPLLWMLSLSLSDNDALQRTRPVHPDRADAQQLHDAFPERPTPSWMWNSMVTVTTTFLTLVLSSMAGYAFARIPFRGKRIAFPLVLAGLMVPKEAMFIPLFLIFADFFPTPITCAGSSRWPHPSACSS